MEPYDYTGSTAPNNLHGLKPFPAFVPDTLGENCPRLVRAATGLPAPIAADYHEPSNSLILSLNFPDGRPCNFVRLGDDGAPAPFSAVAGLTDPVEMTTVRSPAAYGLGGGGANPFIPGDLFAASGTQGRIIRITDGGDTVIAGWAALPGVKSPAAGISLHMDRTGIWGGDLIAAGGDGRVWRIDGAGAGTLIADLKVGLNGLLAVPDNKLRYGRLAGRLLAGNPAQGRIYAIDRSGGFRFWTLSDEFGTRVDIEDIELVTGNQAFFGIEFTAGALMTAAGGGFATLAGDILLSDRMVQPGASGLYLLRWDFATMRPVAIRCDVRGELPYDWENMVFAPAACNAISRKPQATSH